MVIISSQYLIEQQQIPTHLQSRCDSRSMVCVMGKPQNQLFVLLYTVTPSEQQDLNIILFCHME